MDNKKYTIENSTYFITAKNREITQKYKKTIEWIDDMIKNGDMDVAEKMLRIFDKWKREYDRKIESIKSLMREEYVFTETAKSPSEKIKKRKERIEKTKKRILDDFKNDKKLKDMFEKAFKIWLKEQETQITQFKQKVAKNADAKLPDYKPFHYDLMETIKFPPINIIESKVKDTVDKMGQIDDWFTDKMKKSDEIFDPEELRQYVDDVVKGYNEKNKEKFPEYYPK